MLEYLMVVPGTAREETGQAGADPVGMQRYAEPETAAVVAAAGGPVEVRPFPIEPAGSS